MIFTYKTMRIEDYSQMYSLWQSIPTVGLNEADTKEKIETYLLRNPEQSFICEADGKIIGTVMCGNDGRRAFIYHLAVLPEYRRNGIATELVRLAVEKQKLFGIDKCAVFILEENTIGKSFWAHLGFTTVSEAQTMAKRIV